MYNSTRVCNKFYQHMLGTTCSVSSLQYIVIFYLTFFPLWALLCRSRELCVSWKVNKSFNSLLLFLPFLSPHHSHFERRDPASLMFRVPNNILHTHYNLMALNPFLIYGKFVVTNFKSEFLWVQ